MKLSIRGICTAFAILGVIAAGSPARAGGPAVGYVFAPDTPIRAQEVNSNFQELSDRIAALDASLQSLAAREAVSFHYVGPANMDILTNGNRQLVITDIVFGGRGGVLSSTSRGYLVRLSKGDGALYHLKLETGVVIEPNETLQLTESTATRFEMVVSGYYL